MPYDLNDPEIQSAIKEAGFMSADEATALAEEKNAALFANKESILEQLRTTKSELDKYKGLDIATIERLKEDERFEKILNKGFDGYESSLGGELKERLNAAKSDLMLKEQQIQQLQSEFQATKEADAKKIRNSELLRNLHYALTKAKDFNNDARGDVERDALSQLDFDQNGNIIVLGEGGIARQTTNGAMTVDDWLQEMREKKSYRFMGAAGAQNSSSGYSEEELGQMDARAKRRAARRQ